MRIDRRRKLPVTTLLLALDSKDTEAEREKMAAEGKKLDPHQTQGMSAEDILDYYYDRVVYTRVDPGWRTPFDAERCAATS